MLKKSCLALKFYFLCIILLNAQPAFSVNKLVYYQPAKTKLTGVVFVKTFPGRPNYEDINTGDEPETGGYLKLDQPIDIDLLPQANRNAELVNEFEKNVNWVQLVVHHEQDWREIKPGRRVQVIGELFHGFNGHHHEKILMIIEKISEISFF